MAVEWEIPIAKDNTDPNPIVAKAFGPQQGEILEQGITNVGYYATDNSENVSPACVIELRVQG